MQIRSFEELVQAVQKMERFRIAVAAANNFVSIAGVLRAREIGLAEPVLFGSRAQIERVARENVLDLEGVEIVDQPDEIAAARAAVKACHDGEAQMLMKGHIHTDDFLRAVLDKQIGLRQEGILMSHVFILDPPDLDRLIFVTDGAMNIAPTLEQKAQIILNAVYLARCFGIEEPKVGALAAVELVNPKMPATLDAAAFAAMDRRGQFPYCIVDGPFGMDNAVSVEAAKIKGINGPCAGQCDILLVPDIEAGNIMVKTFSFLAGGRTAGVVVGASVPIVLTSRADSSEARLYSVATAALMANMARDARLKIGRMHY